jgi:hypothetical protein
LLLLLKGALIRAKIVKQSLMLVGVTVGGAYTATPKSLADSRKGGHRHCGHKGDCGSKLRPALFSG